MEVKLFFKLLKLNCLYDLVIKLILKSIIQSLVRFIIISLMSSAPGLKLLKKVSKIYIALLVVFVAYYYHVVIFKIRITRRINIQNLH